MLSKTLGFLVIFTQKKEENFGKSQTKLCLAKLTFDKFKSRIYSCNQIL